jgi:recombination protein RecA
MYGQGISREGEIIELASSLGIIEKSGAWYSYKGSRIGQGKDNVRNYLQTNKEVAREIEDQVRARLLPPRPVRGAEAAAANTA